MVVGTGGATRGKRVVRVADGVTDAPTLGGGTVASVTQGIALESGTAGQQVAVAIWPDSRVTA